jgi:hypothetical protein
MVRIAEHELYFISKCYRILVLQVLKLEEEEN